MDPKCSRTIVGTFTSCFENQKWLFVQAWGGGRGGRPVWPSPRTPEKAAGSAAIPFGNGERDLGLG